jgi:hypothetical protein
MFSGKNVCPTLQVGGQANEHIDRADQSVRHPFMLLNKHLIIVEVDG